MYWVLFTNGCAKILGLETYPVKGDASHFDPFASLADIRARVGAGARLVSIRADYVRSDGTMDLNATYRPAPNVTYQFQVPAKGKGKAPPIGAGGGANSAWVQSVEVSVYQPGQRRHRTTISGNSRTSYDYTNEGMEIERGSVMMSEVKPDLGDPKTSTQDLWKIALSKGAPKDAVATISYDSFGFEFSIRGAIVSFRCDANGKLKD